MKTPAIDPEEILLTRQQVSELLGLSTRYVDKLIAEKSIPAYKFGAKGSVRLKKRDVEKYREAHRKTA